MVFGSLVELHAWLHSCLCFSLLEKLFLKASSTPPWHILDTWLSIELLRSFFYRNLDRSSTAGGSNKKVPRPSIASRHLVDQSSLNSCVWCFVPRHFLDTYICRQPNPQHLARHLDRHLLLSRFTEPLYIGSVWSILHFCQSLSWYLCLLTSQNSFSHSKPLPKCFSSFFKAFSTLGKFLLLHLHAFHILKPRIWGFWEILGLFKIDELLLNFWDGFSLK